MRARTPPPLTPDGRYLVVRGRLWRATNPHLPEDARQRLVDALMNARRDVRTAGRGGDAVALADARAAVDAAKRGLGERGPVWWNDGTPDYNRHMATNTAYADWWREEQERALTDRPGFTTERLDFTDEVLAEAVLPDRTLRVTRGLGSGLARHAGEPANRFWALGDRGPNLKVKRFRKRYGVKGLRRLEDLDGAKIMPFLEHGPAICECTLEQGAVRVVRVLPLRGQDDRPLSGLPVPSSTNAECEPIFSLEGEPLGTNASGLDSEGLVALADGGFWVGDEYGPSLLRLDAHARVTMRWVPAGTEMHHAGASYPVAGVLPALAATRKLNRGFEALALSPDETLLTLAFQSPLAHPDRDAHESSRNVRLWRLDAATGALVAEFVYQLDLPENFRRDAALGAFAQRDVKVSEILTLRPDRLLVLERGSVSTRLYLVDLPAALATPPTSIDPATRPTIEQMDDTGLAAAGVTPLPKTLLFDTDDAREIPPDLEGMILLSPRALLLVNDNDFGVEGGETHFWRVTFDREIT